MRCMIRAYRLIRIIRVTGKPNKPDNSENTDNPELPKIINMPHQPENSGKGRLSELPVHVCGNLFSVTQREREQQRYDLPDPVPDRGGEYAAADGLRSVYRGDPVYRAD